MLYDSVKLLSLKLRFFVWNYSDMYKSYCTEKLAEKDFEMCTVC